MANVIVNSFCAKGPSAIVEEIVKEHFKPALDAGLPIANDVLDGFFDLGVEEDGLRTVGYTFESRWDPPYEWFKTQVRCHHHLGVRFFLSWYDSDNVYGEEEPYCSRFGEAYTSLIPYPRREFHRESGEYKFSESLYTTVFGSPTAGLRFLDGPITVVFNNQEPQENKVREYLMLYGYRLNAFLT